MEQHTEREGLQRLWDAEERIAALEEMLANAREREHELTTEAVRHRARIFEADARIFELSSVAARVTAAEDARRDAEAVAQEHERAAAAAKGEAKAAEIEIALLRSRNSELERDLASVAEELAAATVARTEAVRLEQERNEDRERAQVERRMAAEGRLRTAEAALRATDPPAALEGAPAPRSAEVVASAPSAAVADDTHEAAPNGPHTDPVGQSAPSDRPIDAGETAPAPAVGVEEPRGVAVGEPPSVDGTAATEDAEESAPPSEKPASPLWSASKSAASIATTADPWGPSEPATDTPSPSGSDDGASKEPDVIDLTDEVNPERRATTEEKQAAFEERVNLDASARSTGGWADTWGVIRGRRKD